MRCDVIKDLIPLHIDGCCSEESSKIVDEHVKSCEACRALFESMKQPCDEIATHAAPIEMRKINHWKASVLQSVLLFLCFATITVGVAWEASIPSGLMNGFWARNLVIPATGFMLSLANWYFVSVYKSRKTFSNCSLFATLGITVGAYIWAAFHYEVNVFTLLVGRSLWEVLAIMLSGLLMNGRGIVLTIVFCVLSKTLSNQFAKMMGKE